MFALQHAELEQEEGRCTLTISCILGFARPPVIIRAPWLDIVHIVGRKQLVIFKGDWGFNGAHGHLIRCCESPASVCSCDRLPYWVEIAQGSI